MSAQSVQLKTYEKPTIQKINLAELVAKIRKLGKERGAIVSRLGKKDKEITKTKEFLKAAVVAGGTTGNKYRDYVIREHEGPDGRQERWLRGIDEKLKGHTGQLVLIVSHKKVPVGPIIKHGAPGPSRPGRSHIVSPDSFRRRYKAEIEFRTGVLTADAMYLDDGPAVIPTSGYLLASLDEGDVSIPSLEMNLRTDKPMLAPVRAGHSIPYSLLLTVFDFDFTRGLDGNEKLVVGDDAVRKWFGSKHTGLFEKCAQVLGRTDLLPPPKPSKEMG